MRSRALVLAVAACVALLFAAAAGAQSLLDRTSTDRADEAIGPQIHAVYAVPSDGPDAALDTSGTLGAWLTGFNGWFARQTGGTTLRLDTAGGTPDVTFLHLSETTAALAGRAEAAVRAVYGDLVRAGLSDPTKKYVVAIPGVGDPNVCGIATQSGPLALVFVNHCSGVRREFVAGHELLHTLGAVDACGAHADATGHVSGGEDDLMYAYTQPLDVEPLLDPGHDDYWGPAGDNHMPASCPASANVANSIWLTSHPFYRVVVTGAAHGSIELRRSGESTDECTAAEPCAEVVQGGAVLDLTPDADDGYRFVGWTGVSCSDADCSVTVAANATIGATFVPEPHLAIAVTGAGRVSVPALETSCTKRCDLALPYQEATVLRPPAAKGSRFAGWSGACHGTAVTCSVTLSADSAATARFAKPKPAARCRPHQRSS